MKKIVLTGGGTAGHVTPHLALLPSLAQEGFDVLYIGSRMGVERELIEKAGVPYFGVSTGKLRRYFSVENITDMFRVIKGVGEAYSILKKHRPALVFSKGGFVGVPVTYAARLLKIPVVLHEGDYSLGLANKLSAKHAKAICVCFPETLQTAPSGKSYLTGMPIRAELLAGSKEKGYELCGFNLTDKPVLLVMGGSMGAVKINAALREILPNVLEKFNVIHICGKGNLDTAITANGYYQTQYAAKEMPHFYAAADIVVSRAGANSAAELLALNKPTLFIPLGASQSRGDQILNARFFEQNGYARVLPQEDLTPEKLLDEICNVYDIKGEYVERMKTAPCIDAVKEVMEIIKKYI